MNGLTIRYLAGLIWCVSSLALAVDIPKDLNALNGVPGANGTVELKEVMRWSGLASWPTSLAFSADDATLAIGLKNNLLLMDTASRVEQKSIELKSGQVRSLAFSPDGTLLAIGGYQYLGLYDVQKSALVQELKGHRGFVTAIAFSPDGKRLASACEDELGRIWTISPEPVSITLKGHGYPVNGIAWSPRGDQIATAAGDEFRPTKPGEVWVWDATTGQVTQKFGLHTRAASAVTFSPDGKHLLSTSLDEHVNVYDLTEMKALGYFGGHSRPTNGVAIHPDGETAISISGGRAVGKNELIAWEFATGVTLASVEAHEARISAMAVAHDGRLVATGGQDKSVALWNTAFLSIGIPESPASVAVNSSDLSNTADQPLADGQVLATNTSRKEEGAKMLRVGVIGLDTSHATAFAKTLNANPPVSGAEGCRVVAAYPKGSPDIKSSIERVPGYVEEYKKMRIEIVDSIDELVKQVDVVLLETNDGRPHYEQLLPVLKAGKPCFIDKPIAGTLADAIAIFDAAARYKVPVFSSSSLRFGKNSQAVRNGSIGKIQECETTSPAQLEATHPDLFWYGIHGVESLFTVMGRGCESVVRTTSPDGKIVVTGQWNGGRTGTYREGPGYQGKAVGENGEAAVGSYDGYDPLVKAIVHFFKTGEAPVTAEETLEIYAFMEAADESKRQNGERVTLESVMAKAKEEAKSKTEK